MVFEIIKKHPVVQGVFYFVDTKLIAWAQHAIGEPLR